MNPPINILVIEDDEVSAFIAQTLLSEHPEVGTVQLASNLHRAESLMDDGNIQLVLVDIHLPNRNGMEWLAERSAQDALNCHAVVLSASDRPDFRNQALAIKEVLCYEEKPLSEEAVSRILSQAVSAK